MPRLYTMETVPSAAEYVAGFQSVAITETDRAILEAQYGAPEHTSTASGIARVAGIRHHGVVNLRYGRLGRRLANAIGVDPDRRRIGKERWWAVLSNGWSLGPSRFAWRMYPEVASALEQLGWVRSGSMPAEEIRRPEEYLEGASVRVAVNAFERNGRARQACIDHYGYDCTVCGFNFARTYGSAGENLIHVHHVVPLAAMGQEYFVDPIEDLRPVCANCHAIIHRREPPYSIEEARTLLMVASA